MLSGMPHAKESCCGKCKACRQPCRIIEGSKRWQWCSLIEVLMLLCILEEDVGYRPSIRTVRRTIGQGQDLRLLICRESRFRWFCGIGHQGQLGQSRLCLDVVYI